MGDAERYQAELLNKCLHAFHADSMVDVFYIWQFCGMRTCRQIPLVPEDILNF